MRSPSLGFSILITSAPMSPRMRVQCGPETDTSSASTFTPASADGPVLFGLMDLGEQILRRSVGSLPDHYCAYVVDHDFAFLLDAPRAYFHQAPLRAGLRLALIDYFGFRIQRVSGKQGVGQFDFVPS